MEVFQIHSTQNPARVRILLKKFFFFFFLFGLVRTLLEDFERQLRENQSKRDFLRLISCLEGLVILSRSTGTKRQFDETHIRVDARTLMTVHALVPWPGERTAANSLADLLMSASSQGSWRV